MLANAKAISPKTKKCLKPHGTSGFRHYGANWHCIKDGMNIEKYPDWFVPRRVPEGTKISKEELQGLPEVPFMAMVASVGSNDMEDMYKYLGGIKNK